jgi:hypothetical protein
VLLRERRRFVEFCTSDVARYQLLFQHSVPDSPRRRSRSHLRCVHWKTPARFLPPTGSPIRLARHVRRC